MDANQIIAIATPALLVAIVLFMLNRWTTKRDRERAKEETDDTAARERIATDLNRVEADLRSKIQRREDLIASLAKRHDSLAAEAREELRVLSERIGRLEEYRKNVLEKLEGCVFPPKGERC